MSVSYPGENRISAMLIKEVGIEEGSVIIGYGQRVSEVRKKKRICPQVKIFFWVSDNLCPLRRLILLYNRYRPNCMKERNYDL